MPWLACKSGRIHYELAGPEDGPACVLVNGLTQYLKLWMPFRDAMVARGFRVASYDMLGQGHSDKPRLFIETMQIVGRGKADLGDATRVRAPYIGCLKLRRLCFKTRYRESEGSLSGFVDSLG